MNSVPYIMFSASKIHDVGAFRMYRLKTSMQTISISEMISHEVTLPAHVLMRSAVCSRRWTFMPEAAPDAVSVQVKQRHHAADEPAWCRELLGRAQAFFALSAALSPPPFLAPK